MKSSLHYALFLLLLLAFSFAAWSSGEAQTASWKPPVKLYETRNQMDLPILLSDPAGRLHLFWAENETNIETMVSSGTVYYMTRAGEVWVGPFDVLYHGRFAITSLRGAIDAYGRAHLAYRGNLASLSHARSETAELTDGRSWVTSGRLSDPSRISVNLAIDRQQVLHLVSTEAESTAEEWISDDLGSHWQGPAYLGEQLPSDQAMTSIILRFDAAGGMHFVWTLVPLPDGYPPLGSFYSHSQDGGASWSQPVMLAPREHQVVDFEVGNGDTLHVLYIGKAGVGGRYHRWSWDGGANWSEAAALSLPEEGTGLSGGDLAFDSANRLHAVYGLGAAEIIAHSVWDGSQWSWWEDISLGRGDHGEEMKIAVTEGNRLHVVWRDNQADGSFAIWYVEGQTDSPGVEAQPFPALSQTAEPTPTAAGGAAGLQGTPAIPTAVPDLGGEAPADLPSVGLPLLLGLAIGLAAALGAVFYQVVVREVRR